MSHDTDCFEELGKQIAESLGQGPSAEHLFWQESAIMSAAGKRRHHRLWFFLPVTATAAAVFCLLMILVPADEKSFGYRVRGEQPQGSLALLRSTGERLPVDFDDGSRIELLQDSAGKIVELSSEQVVVRLEHGKIFARIRNVPARDWRIQAGNFEVDVVGTEFDVSWLPETGSLEVAVTRGVVLVGGPGLGPAGRKLTAGEHLSIVGSAPVSEQGREETAENDALAMVKRAPQSPPALRKPILSPAEPQQPSSVPPSTDGQVEPGATGGSSERVNIMAWKLLHSVGEYRSALHAAKQEGMERLQETIEEDDLWSLGEACRLAGDGDLATQVLKTFRSRFPGSRRAGVAAFLLASVSGELNRDPEAACHWFSVYLEENPRGPLAEEALGRMIKVAVNAGLMAKAVETAGRYLAEYPEGRHASLARSLLFPDNSPTGD